MKVLNLRRMGGWVSTLSRVTRLRLFILSEKHPLLLKRDIVRDREGDGAEEKGGDTHSVHCAGIEIVKVTWA